LLLRDDNSTPESELEDAVEDVEEPAPGDSADLRPLDGATDIFEDGATTEEALTAALFEAMRVL